MLTYYRLFLKSSKSLINLPLVSDWINDKGRFNMVYGFGQATRSVLFPAKNFLEIAIDLRPGSFNLDLWSCLVPRL